MEENMKKDKQYFYVIVCHPVAGDTLTSAQLLGGSGKHDISITYWAEYSYRLTKYKDACMFIERVRMEYPNKNWAMEKYLMDREQWSFARPKNYPKEPSRYKNEIDFAEEERNLTEQEKHDREVEIRKVIEEYHKKKENGEQSI